MARKAAVVCLCALTALGAYGFWHGRLFEIGNWTPEGRTRLLAFVAVYCSLAVALHLAAKRIPRLNPAVVIGALVAGWTIWWSGPVALLAAVYLFGSCYFLGRLAAPKVSGPIQLVLGAALWVFVLWIALHFPVNRRSVYAVALALPYLALFKFPAARISRPRLPEPSWGLYVLLFFLAAHWLAALKPEMSADGLSMHLALPIEVMRSHQWHFDVTRENWAVMPAAGDTFFTAAFLLGGETAAKLANIGMIAAICAMIVGFLRRWLNPSQAYLSAALFASTPLALLVTGSLFVENYWAAMTLAGTILLLEGELPLAAVLLGSAVAGKLIAVVFAGLAAVFAWKREGAENSPENIRHFERAVALFAVFAAPPYLFAAWKTHNPIFPFANDVFHSAYYDDTQPFRDLRFSEPVRWTTPFDLTFDSARFVEGRPGSPGFQFFFLLIPGLIVAYRRRSQAVSMAWVGVASVGALCFVLPNLRYMYAALPLLSIGIAPLLAEFAWAQFAFVGVAGLNLAFFTAAGWYDLDFALFDKRDVVPYLIDHAPARLIVPTLDPHQPAAAFDASIGEFPGPKYTSSWHQEAYWKKIRESKSSADVATEFRRLGIRQIIARADLESPFPVVETFLHEWAEPVGKPYGESRLLRLRDTPVPYTPAPPRLSKGSYDDGDSRLVFKGAWYHDPQFAEAAGHTITYSDVPGASLLFRFEGTGFVWTFTAAPNRGKALVIVDGVELGAVPLYSPTVKWQQPAEFLRMSPGKHSVEIRVLPGEGERAFVDVDRIEIE